MSLGNFLTFYIHFLIDKMGVFTAYDCCEENPVNFKPKPCKHNDK